MAQDAVLAARLFEQHSKAVEVKLAADESRCVCPMISVSMLACRHSASLCLSCYCECGLNSLSGACGSSRRSGHSSRKPGPRWAVSRLMRCGLRHRSSRRASSARERRFVLCLPCVLAVAALTIQKQRLRDEQNEHLRQRALDRLAQAQQVAEESQALAGQQLDQAAREAARTALSAQRYAGMLAAAEVSWPSVYDWHSFDVHLFTCVYISYTQYIYIYCTVFGLIDSAANCGLSGACSG